MPHGWQLPPQNRSLGLPGPFCSEGGTPQGSGGSIAHPEHTWVPPPRSHTFLPAAGVSLHPARPARQLPSDPPGGLRRPPGPTLGCHQLRGHRGAAEAQQDHGEQHRQPAPGQAGHQHPACRARCFPAPRLLLRLLGAIPLSGKCRLCCSGSLAGGSPHPIAGTSPCPKPPCCGPCAASRSAKRDCSHQIGGTSCPCGYRHAGRLGWEEKQPRESREAPARGWAGCWVFCDTRVLAGTSEHGAPGSGSGSIPPHAASRSSARSRLALQHHPGLGSCWHTSTPCHGRVGVSLPRRGWGQHRQPGGTEGRGGTASTSLSQSSSVKPIPLPSPSGDWALQSERQKTQNSKKKHLKLGFNRAGDAAPCAIPSSSLSATRGTQHRAACRGWSWSLGHWAPR